MKGLIEAALVVAIVVGATAIVVSTVTPLISQGKSQQDFISAKNTLSEVDSAMQQLMLEAVGSRRQIDLDVGTGKFIVAGDEEKFKIRLEGYQTIEPGSTIQEGNIQIRGGSAVEAVEEEQSDGSTDLVLRNSLVTFAVKKIGGPSNWSQINTTSMITQFTNRRTGTTVHPKSGIFINDKPLSSAGFGYTQLTTQSSNIASGSIEVFVNSTAGISYDAVFTLSSASDFVDLQVLNIHGA